MERVYPDSRIFQKFAKGAVTTARTGRLIEEKLAVINAAGNAGKLGLIRVKISSNGEVSLGWGTVGGRFLTAKTKKIVWR